MTHQGTPELTPRQQEYLNELADGPKTTRDIEISMKVCEVYDRNFVGAEIAAEYELAIKARGMTHTPPLTSYFPETP